MSCSHWLGERCTWPRLWRRAKIVNSAPESDEIIKDQLIWNRLQFFFRHLGSWNKGAAPNKEPGILAPGECLLTWWRDTYSAQTGFPPAQPNIWGHILIHPPSISHSKKALPTPSSPRDWMEFLSSWSRLKSLKGLFGAAQEKVLSPWAVAGNHNPAPSQAHWSIRWIRAQCSDTSSIKW